VGDAVANDYVGALLLLLLLLLLMMTLHFFSLAKLGLRALLIGRRRSIGRKGIYRIAENPFRGFAETVLCIVARWYICLHDRNPNFGMYVFEGLRM
jgi:hypothetical protein